MVYQDRGYKIHLYYVNADDICRWYHQSCELPGYKTQYTWYRIQYIGYKIQYTG